MRALCSAPIGSRLFAIFAFLAVAALAGSAPAQVFQARDPGPRPGPAGAGGPLPGLTSDEIDFFFEAKDVFEEVDSVSGAVAGEEGSGLGPTFNANSCASCHAQPETRRTPSSRGEIGGLRAQGPS